MSELYSLPNGWEWKKLGKIAKLQNGFAFKSKLFVNDGLPIVRIKNIKNEKVLLDDVVYFNVEDYGKKLDSYQIKKNDILIAMSGATTGKIGLYDTEEISYLNQRVGLFRIENSNLRSYLFYFLSTQIEKNLELSLGAAQPNLSTEQINNIELPLPPFEEQKRIVAKLDNLFAKIDKAIALHQKNIDEVNVFMASVLNDVFVELEEKYEKLFLNDVSTFQNGFAFKSNEFNTTGNGLQVIRIGNVLDINKNQVFIEKRKEFEKYLLKENDIVISMTGTRGKKDYLFVRVITSNDSYLNQRVGKISNKNNSNYMYLYYFLQSNYFRDKIFEFETGTVNQGNISSKDILNTKIPLPNMQVQQKVVSYLDEISNKMEKIKQIQKDKMQSLKELKASILDKAFKGEL